MRIVLDINVLVSNLISKSGVPGQLLTLWRDRHYILIVSVEQIERMEDVLGRPRLEPFVNSQEAEELIAELLNAAVVVDPDRSIDLLSDTEDNIILGTAIAGQADPLVSGDKKHLLPLGVVEGIPILSPREAIEKILPGSSA